MTPRKNTSIQQPGIAEQLSDLLTEAAEAYEGEPEALASIDALRRRLEEPLRVALAGMVKAGKSTLINAIIGEEVAPTDAGECTKVVTWYRYAHTPRLTLHLLTGEERPLRVKRVKRRLTLDLGEVTADEVHHLVVDWPSKRLRDLTLIDTPGIASLSEEVSARSTEALMPAGAPSEVDCVVYLMRHLHETDVAFLESLKERRTSRGGAANAIAVLSRADEIGAGRIDSLVSARAIAERYGADEGLSALVMGVVPIAGLLAESAHTLRETDFTAMQELAGMERRQRERLMVSADRFVNAPQSIMTPAERTTLLERFGLYGLRLGSVLIRSGFSEATQLAPELARRSGLDEVLALIGDRFQARAGDLKASAVLEGLELVLRQHPSEDLADSVERMRAGAHEFRELELLAQLRTGGIGVQPELAAEIERLIGGRGVGAAERLGLAEPATSADLYAHAMRALNRWRTLAEDPMLDHVTTEVCQVVMRSCEATLASTQARSAGVVSSSGRLGDPEPGGGGRNEAGDQRRAG